MAVLSSATGKGMGQNTQAYSHSAGPRSKQRLSALLDASHKGLPYSTIWTQLFSFMMPSHQTADSVQTWTTMIQPLQCYKWVSEQSHKPKQKSKIENMVKNITQNMYPLDFQRAELSKHSIDVSSQTDNSIRFVHFLL